MLLTLEEARNCLRVDEDSDDTAIMGMILAVEGYIQTATGMTPEQMEMEPMARTAAWHMLRQWYDMDPRVDASYQRIIDSMLKSLTVRARDYNRCGESASGLY